MVAVDAADLTLGGGGASALGDELGTTATGSLSSIIAASETESRDLLEDVYHVA